MLFLPCFSFRLAFFFLGFKSMDMEEDCEEGDNFLLCNCDSFRGEGVWGLFSLVVKDWGILAYWILLND